MDRGGDPRQRKLGSSPASGCVRLRGRPPWHGLLRIFSGSKHPLDAANLGKNARNITFREAGLEDIPSCLAYYRANEAAHFPPGGLAEYESVLRQKKALTLMATRNGKPVGCCGLLYPLADEEEFTASFVYGLVDPAHQRQGVGTAQVLVRLALLTPVFNRAVAAMCAVANSVSFYERFGFEFFEKVPAADGHTLHVGILQVSHSFIDDCREELARRNIQYPDVQARIPRSTKS